MPRTLLDTSILLRPFDPHDNQHEINRKSLRMLRANEHRLYTTTQNIAEFWSVATRPVEARGGYGRSVAAVQRQIAFPVSHLDIRSEDRAAFLKWQDLVVAHKMVGVSVHDTRIAANMIVRDIPHLVTLNKADLLRFEDTIARSPDEILAA